MAEFIFDPKRLKDGLILARIVKPEIGDFSVKFENSTMIVSSADKRKHVKAVIPAESAPVDFELGEIFISFDKISLFDTELDSVSITINDKTISVKMHGGGQVRKASIPKKIVRVKTSDPSVGLDDVVKSSIDRNLFDNLLRQISCSALIKETKTEEDMRINQIHFYSDENCVVSNARYYGSIAFLDGMKLDLSIISSDIPIIRAFCAKCQGSTIDLLCNSSKLCVIDPETGSMLILGRITTSKPILTVLDSNDFQTEVLIDKDQLSKNLSWASLVVEGTQRLGVDAHKTSGQDGQIQLFFGQDEISSFPIKFVKGDEIKADFPINVLTNIVGFIEKTVTLRFHHNKTPTILEISQGEGSNIKALHYLQSMRTR
jgi:hypothetical protein